jgi:hypothetical protein
MKWAEHAASMGGKKKVYKALVGKLEAESSLGRQRRS